MSREQDNRVSQELYEKLFEDNTPVNPLPSNTVIDMRDLENRVGKRAVRAGFGGNVFLQMQLVYSRNISPVQKELFNLSDIPTKGKEKKRIDNNAPKRYSLSISDLETLYRVVCARNGIYVDKKLYSGEFDEAQTPLTHGMFLHREDALYNLLIQGISGDAVYGVFPTHKKENVRAYKEAIDGLDGLLSWRASEDAKKMFEALDFARRRFYEIQNLDNICIDVPIEGFGVPSKLAKEKLVTSSEFESIGQKLAESWICESLKIKRADNLTLRNDCVTLREIGITVNMPGMQIKTRLDGLTMNPGKGSRRAEISEFKTGSPITATLFENEIRLRQAQMMIFCAERFIENYIFGQKHLSGQAVVMINSIAEMWKSPRSEVAINYRYFNKNDGSISLLRYQMSEDDREDFIRWLLAVGNTLMLERAIIKKLHDREKVNTYAR